MKKILVLFLASLCCTPLANAGSITGQMQTPSSGRGVPNGTLTFTLSQSAVVSGTATLAGNGNCWTDSSGNVVGLPGDAALAAPLLSSNLGSGSLGSGTYFVRYTWANATGESQPSAERSLLLGSAGTLIVQAPANVPALATSMKVYIGATAGGESLQGSVAVTSGVIAGNYSQSSSLVSGAALPSSNSSVCQIRFNDELQPSFTAYSVAFTNLNGAGIAGFPQKWYLSGGSNGTVNVSNGTPLYAGVVQYPQAIVSNPAANGTQSINGGLNLNGFPLGSASKVNNIFYAGPGPSPTIDTQLAACGSNPCEIVVDPLYTGTYPPVNAIGNNVIITDYSPHGPSNPLALGTNTISYNSQTPGVFSWIRRNWTTCAPSASQSCEEITDVASFTGSLPNNQTMEADTATATTSGTISGGGSGLAVVAYEGHSAVQSNGGTVGRLYSAVFSSQLASGNTNVTNAVGVDFQGNTNTGTGTITNSYGALFEPQNGGSTRNYGFWNQGNFLMGANGGGWNIDTELSGGSTQHRISEDNSGNLYIYGVSGKAIHAYGNPGGARYWTCSGQCTFDPDNVGFTLKTGSGGLQVNGGQTVTGTTGTGNSLVTSTGPSVTNAALSTPSVGGETITHPTHAGTTFYISGTTSTGTFGRLTPDDAIAVTRLEITCFVAGSAQTTAPILKLYDSSAGSPSTSLTLSNGVTFADSGAISLAIPAGDHLDIRVDTANSGGSAPSACNAAVQYKMQ